MRRPEFTAILILQFFLAARALFGQTLIQGQVKNQGNSRPIPFANVVVLGLPQGAACDSSGVFRLLLPPGDYRLEFSAIGFKTLALPIAVRPQRDQTITVSLAPTVIELSDEIVVYGENELDKIDDWLNSTDDIIARAEGVSLMQRGNYALEPSIRGMSAGRIGLVVDGMKIFSACVDRMDPVTAYVEVENLDRMEISKGAFDMSVAPGAGGAINMITQKPDFSRPLQIQSEAGYESVSALRRFRSEVNYARSAWAARGTFSIKESGDFYAGGRTRIINSGYHKINYKFDFSRKFGRNQLLELSFIGDDARDIGYPSLLMDAARATSQIYRVEHHWDSPFPGIQSMSSKIYFNRIDHWMDDDKRDVTVREVMPDMHMPMFGKTRTIGAMETIKLARNKHLFKFILEAYRLTAFADMRMISIFPDVSEMYLLNIGDARLSNVSAVFDYQRFLSSKLRFRSNVRLDYSHRNLRDEDGRRLLGGFWGDENLQRNYTAAGASAVVEYSLGAHQTVQLALAQGQRLPSHIENYGFFLYNYTDGYFYTGNPSLEPERSRQAEIVLEHAAKPLHVRLNLFSNDIHNYIAGVPASQEFKVYTNLSSAYLTGFELKIKTGRGKPWLWSASAAYTYAQNRELNEPLPLIPPLGGNMAIQYSRGRYWFALDSRLASRQTRAAQKTTLEDPTPGFIVFNLRSRIQLRDVLDLKFGVENIFDRRYHEHLSINNLPGRGRNVYLGLHVRFGE